MCKNSIALILYAIRRWRARGRHARSWATIGRACVVGGRDEHRVTRGVERSGAQGAVVEDAAVAPRHGQKGMGQRALWRAVYPWVGVFWSRPCRGIDDRWRHPGLREGSTWRDLRSAATAAALLRHPGRGWELGGRARAGARAAARSRSAGPAAAGLDERTVLLRPLDAPRHCGGLRLPTTTYSADRQSGAPWLTLTPIGKSAAKTRRPR